EHVLGRDVTCRIRFNDPSVSRRHVRIVVDPQVVLIEDLRSMNGSTVNGEPLIGQRPLADGDVVTMGDREVRVRIRSGGELAKAVLSFQELPTAPPEGTEPRSEEHTSELQSR